MEDDPSSPVDGIHRAPSTLTSVRGPVSPTHSDGLISSGTPHRAAEAGQPDQRSEFLRVFTGLAHQTGPGSRPQTLADNSLDCAECTTTTTVTHSDGGSDSGTNISILSSYPSMENIRSCMNFQHSLIENSTNSESEPMQESLLSAGFAKSENVDQYEARTREYMRRTEIDYETQPSPVDSCQAEAVSSVQPAAAFTVDTSKSLADRIDGARQCCSAMRVDISTLSTRCDTLSSRLHDIRTHLASLPFGANGVTTAGTVTSVSLAVDVRQTSCLRVSSSSLPSAVLCSSVASSSEFGGNGPVTDSSRTSLSILQRVEKELSVRLEELTAYVSSSDMQAEQTQEDEGAGADIQHFADRGQHTCHGLRDTIPVSSGCESASNSLYHPAGKEPNGLRKEGAFLRSTSAMLLTPPLSDESSSQNEDEASRRERPEAGDLQTPVTSWAGHEDFMSTTPLLYAQSFGSDWHTPPIEALTCLESFSDSGRLKLVLPTADAQSLLQSSVMIHTPPLSDHSAGSDDQNRCADGGDHSSASQAAQPHVTNIPEQHTSFSDCTESDWKDYYTENYWSCPSPSSEVQDSDVPTKDQANDVEKLPTIHHVCKERISKPSQTESEMTIDNCKANSILDDGAEKETQCSACRPMPRTNTESGVQKATVQSLVEPQGGSRGEYINRNNKFECETDALSGLQKQHREVLLEAPQKSLNKSSPHNNSKQNKKEDDRDSAEVLGCLTDVYATNVLKSMPSIVPNDMESDLISENRFQDIINPSVDIQEAVDSGKEDTNSVMVKSNHLLQGSFIPELSVLPESHPKNNLNIPENHSTTKTQSFAAEIEAGSATRVSVQLASSASSSERTDVSSDDRGQPQQMLNDPATSQEMTSKGVNQTIASITVTLDLHQHASSLSLEESKAGKWKPQQKRIRQHRSARHLQHLSTAQAQARCSPQSLVAESTIQAPDDANSAEQSYSDLENMSCSFNFLRERSSPPLKDANNNALLPLNIVLPQTCFQTLGGEAQTTQGYESFKSDNVTAHYNCLTTRTLSTTGSSNAPAQQNRKCTVSLAELKTRMYTVTKVKAMEVGLCIQQYSSGQENGKADSQGYFTYTTNRQNEEHRCSRTKVTLSACKKAQEQVAAAKNTLSDVTYSIRDTQKHHVLSCIAEGENERMGERNTESSQGRVNYSPQITETAEGHAVKRERCPENLHSEVSRIRDRKEDSSVKNEPVSLTGKTTAVLLEPFPTTLAGEKHKSEARRSSNSQKCSSVSARKRDLQDTFANLSFDNHFEIMSTSAPAFYSGNCEMLTSTPVVASQRKDDKMMHAFFNPSQSVEQSCIWEMSAKLHLTSQRSVNVLNDGNEAHNNLIDNNLHGNDSDPDSSGHHRKMADPPKVEASPTIVGIPTQVSTDRTNRSSHLEAPPAHIPLPSNLLPTSDGSCTISAKKGHEGQTRQHSRDDTKAPHAVNTPETIVVAPETAEKEDSSIHEHFSSRKSRTKICDKLSHLSVIMSSAKGRENGRSKLQNNRDNAPGPSTSKPHERAESCPEVLNQVEEKTVSETRTVKAGSHEQSDDRHPESDDGRLAPAKSVPDLLSVRPRPKPLLPTPLYRRSPLSGSTPPCPHCLTLMLHPAPLAPGPAGDWAVPCPQGCGCAHADRCLHRPFGPMDVGGAWGRAYNGPAAICVHHGGTSQSSLPPRSLSGPPDAGRKRAACGSKQPDHHQGHGAVQDTAGVAAKQIQAEGPPTRERGTSTNKARKSVRQGKPEENNAHNRQAPAVTVSKADAEVEARTQTSKGSPSCEGDHRKTDLELKEDVVPLLMVTWTLLLLSLTVAVHDGHSHRSQDQQE